MSRLGRALKVLTGRDEVPARNMKSSDLYGDVYWDGGFPSLIRNYANVRMEPYLNSAFFACVSWLASAAGQAVPYLERLHPDGSKDKLYQHPVLTLLRRPNDYYGRHAMWLASLVSRYACGDTFIQVQTDELGKPVNLWWLPWHEVTPQGGQGRMIHHYDVFSRGRQIPVSTERMLHWRIGIDPKDKKRGMSPLASFGLEIESDQGAGETAKFLIQNLGIEVPLLSPDSPDVTIDDVGRDEIVDRYVSGTTGFNRGKPVVFSDKMKVDMVGAKAKDLDIEPTRRSAATRVCSGFNIDPLVVGLEGNSATYVNKREAREAANESVVMPMHTDFGESAGYTLLPFYKMNPDDWRIAYDYRQVPIMQGDMDKTAQRVALLYTSGIYDRFQALTVLGDLATDADRGVFYSGPGTGNASNPTDTGPNGEPRNTGVS